MTPRPRITTSDEDVAAISADGGRWVGAAGSMRRLTELLK